jgi:ferrochelatase
MATSKLVAEKLQLPKDKYATSFQSRLGRDAWLKPYTAERLKQLPAEGIKKLVIVCPAFVSDCLETIEEIGKEGKEIFMQAGGESFTLIPCMNTQPAWVNAMQKIIESHIAIKEQAFSNNPYHVPVH